MPTASTSPRTGEPDAVDGAPSATGHPDRLAHPRTRQRFPSPVLPGTGWPGDVAHAGTPVARSPDDVARSARRAVADGDLGLVDAASTVCRACPRLVAWREEVAVTRRRAFRDQPYWGRPAAGLGDPRARLLVVGLAPAAHGANRTGRLFTGDRSGDWIFAALHRAGVASQAESIDAADGLTLTDVRIVSAVRCAPPDNAPSPAERATCAGWLRAELELLAPTVRAVVALGAVGWQAALGVARSLGWAVPRPQPRFAHGAHASLVRPDGVVVHLFASYHVSQQNTQTGRLSEAMLDAVIDAGLGAARGSGGATPARSSPAPGQVPVPGAVVTRAQRASESRQLPPGAHQPVERGVFPRDQP